MIWWILGSLAVIGVMAYIAVVQSRKTQESIDAVMHPIYPELAVDMERKEGDNFKPTIINFAPTRTPSHQMPHQTDRRGVRWINPTPPQGSATVGMDVGLDPMDMIILGDAILNSSSDPGYQPDDTPTHSVTLVDAETYTSEPTHYSAPTPVESSSSWGESSSSSSWSDSSSSSSDCGGSGD